MQFSARLQEQHLKANGMVNFVAMGVFYCVKIAFNPNNPIFFIYSLFDTFGYTFIAFGGFLIS